MKLNLGKKQNKCQNCGKPEGKHKADTKNCPIASRGAHTTFSFSQTFKRAQKESGGA